MKCPKCKKTVKRTRVYSEAYQWATIKGNTIIDYGACEELLETIAIECEFCNYDFFKKGEIEE